MINPTPDDWLKAYPIVDRAKGTSPAERQRYLEEACAGAPGVRAAVDLLMERIESSGAFAHGAPLDPQDAVGDLTGEKIGDFEILRLLGHGGMGLVYLARQGRPRREVALKVLRASWRDTERQRRFQKESEVLAALSHPHIASLFQCGTWERPGDIAVPYFVMEFVEGARDLVRHAREEGLEVSERLRLLAGVLGAVAYGHSRGIVHRDLKPDNVLVDGAGHPRVIDFGLARIVEGDDPLQTRTSADRGVVGTLAYMAPEQYTGGEVTLRTDVYALGLILYELLCGRPAVVLHAKSLPGALAELRHYRVPLPSRAVRGLSSDLDRIVRKSTATAAEERYASAAEMLSDLEDHLEGRPLGLAPQLDDSTRPRHGARITLLAIGMLAIGLIAGRTSVGATERDRESGAPPGGPVRARHELAGADRRLADYGPEKGPATGQHRLETDEPVRLSLPAGEEGAFVEGLSVHGGRFEVTGGELHVHSNGNDNSVMIGELPGDDAEVYLHHALLIADRITNVGANVDSHGVLRVGSGGKLISGLLGGWTGIGVYGRGELHVDAWGSVFAQNILSVGDVGRSGVAGRSRATIAGAYALLYTWHLRVGKGHDAVVAVREGGRIIAEHSTWLGLEPGVDGELLLEDNANLTVIAQLPPEDEFSVCVGRFGSGDLRLARHSLMRVGGRTSIGTEAGSRGVVWVTAGSRLESVGLILGHEAGATGRLVVEDAGSVASARYLEAGMPDRGEAVLELKHGAALEVGDRLTLGPSSTLTLDLAGSAGQPLLDGTNAPAWIRVEGSLELGGKLRIMGLPHGEAVMVTLGTASSIAGAFDDIELDPALGGARVSTVEGSVRLELIEREDSEARSVEDGQDF